MASKIFFFHQKVYFWISAFDHRAIVVPKMHIVQWGNRKASYPPGASWCNMWERQTTSSEPPSFVNICTICLFSFVIFLLPIRMRSRCVLVISHSYVFIVGGGKGLSGQYGSLRMRRERLDSISLVF